MDLAGREIIKQVYDLSVAYPRMDNQLRQGGMGNR